jgi:hypothetical protein
MGLLMLPALAWAHGVAEGDKSFLEQSTGLQLVAYTYLGAKHMVTGTHGWYWQNRGTEPVTVEIAVTGFQPMLYRP